MKLCDVSVGQLNRRIGLYKQTKSATDIGGQTVEWSKVADVWTKVNPTSGSELFRNDKLGAVSQSDFVIRYRDNIDETMKLKFRGDDYQIRHIKNIDEADLWLVVRAERGVAQ